LRTAGAPHHIHPLSFEPGITDYRTFDLFDAAAICCSVAPGWLLAAAAVAEHAGTGSSLPSHPHDSLSNIDDGKSSLTH
jgi:hypothetical protein